MDGHLTTWTPVEKHPCTYSIQVLAIFKRLIPRGSRVHDPYAGPGYKMGAMADEMEWIFTGTDLENWPEGRDLRVVQGDARDPGTYPTDPDAYVATSVTYGNRNGSDYNLGPTPKTKLKGRRSYTLALGHVLHPDNTARFRADDPRYWGEHAVAVKLWPDHVVLNCDLTIAKRWVRLLEDHRYAIVQVEKAYTKRHRGLSNDQIRAEYELVMLAVRSSTLPLEAV
jgi:hypothetical protein